MITLSRVFVSPLFILFFVIDEVWSLFICVLLAAVIELSDFLDGVVARKYQQISDFGKLMDPFADSIARFTIFLCFLSVNLAPVWIIVIFFYRDTLVAVVRVFASREGIVVAARRSGKIKAWVQGICIFVVLAVLLMQKTSPMPDIFGAPLYIVLTTVCISIAALVTLWSAIDYWSGNSSVVIKSMKINKNIPPAD